MNKDQLINGLENVAADKNNSDTQISDQRLAWSKPELKCLSISKGTQSTFVSGFDGIGSS